MSAKNGSLTPVKLRAILAVIMILLVILGAVIFMLGYQQVSTHAKDTQSVASQADDSDSTIQNLMALQSQLKQNASIVTRASQLVSESQYYKYQDQIISEITSYAKNAGVEVESISFESSTSATATAGTAASPTTSAAATSALPSGIKTTNATVALRNPVDYTNLLSFIHSLEQSLFRMSISSVSLSRGSGAPGTIECMPLKIEAYIR